ncbi:hypothetical protein DKL61_09120 [Gammaproteobacteria bacterium ESL0073]|nr:hypothetical protein DKL61_09120 [Gammaproteobacteria bacterium ESL0073]
MSMPLIKKGGITKQADIADIEPSAIAYDKDVSYPDNTLPYHMLTIVVSTTIPSINDIKNNQLIVIVDE